LDSFYFEYAQYFGLVGLSIMIIEITNKLFPTLCTRLVSRFHI